MNLRAPSGLFSKALSEDEANNTFPLFSAILEGEWLIRSFDLLNATIRFFLSLFNF